MIRWMKDFAVVVQDMLGRAGLEYGDVRVVRKRRESILIRNGKPETVRKGESLGFGVRVVVDGAWGFAASYILSRAEAERIVRLAVRVAKSSAMVQHRRVRLAPEEPRTARWSSSYLIDPFEIPIERSVERLMQAEALLRGEPVKVSEAYYNAYKIEKVFANSEGSLIEQTLIECGGGLAATAVVGDNLQVRSFPDSFRGSYAMKGYEHFESLQLAENAPKVREEVLELLRAPLCPSGVTTVILDGNQLALQIHESIGHPTELDRVLGMEASFAGGSFVESHMIGSLVYGSEHVNIVADATCPGGVGSFGYDDEGVPAQRVFLIERGLFAGFLSSRETAAELGHRSSGAMRAEGWESIPLIRMTNINLLPGDRPIEDIIAEVDHGLYLDTNRSWSIDDKRLNFQFGTERAREIRHGKLGQVYRNPTYTGITPEFWRACDAVADEQSWRLHGTLNCGKGEPCQLAHVGHGCSPARFRNVRVGVLS